MGPRGAPPPALALAPALWAYLLAELQLRVLVAPNSVVAMGARAEAAERADHQGLGPMAGSLTVPVALPMSAAVVEAEAEAALAPTIMVVASVRAVTAMEVRAAAHPVPEQTSTVEMAQPGLEAVVGRAAVNRPAATGPQEQILMVRMALVVAVVAAVRIVVHP